MNETVALLAARAPKLGRTLHEARGVGDAYLMIVRTPDERLRFLQAIASRRKEAVADALPGPFTGTLIADGYPHPGTSSPGWPASSNAAST